MLSLNAHAHVPGPLQEFDAVPNDCGSPLFPRGASSKPEKDTVVGVIRIGISAITVCYLNDGVGDFGGLHEKIGSPPKVGVRPSRFMPGGNEYPVGSAQLRDGKIIRRSVVIASLDKKFKI